MMKKRILALTMAICMAGSALAGCGGKKDAGTESGGTSQAAAAAQEPSSQAASGGAASEGEKAYGGEIRIAANASPATLFLPQAPDTGCPFYASPAAEELGRMEMDGTITPWLAEDLITDPDNLTYTIKLREGVKFHDGSLCDAEAVKWNLDKMIESGKAAELNNPVSVETTDDWTVVIQYDKWSNNWDSVVGAVRIISKQAYEEHGEEWCKINIVGTGPFKFDSFVQDSSLRFVRNDEYRIAGQPYVDAIEFLVIPDANTQVSAFQNGEIDAIYTYDSVVINTLLSQGYTNIAQKSANLANIKYVLFNSKDKEKPLGNLQVRQAVMHSIDWENIAKALSGGYGEASPLFCTSDSWAYHPDAEFLAYDTELAKKLLAEAGYPDGFDTVINTVSKNQDIAVALQACLQEIGVRAEINVMDASEMNAKQKADNMEGFIMGNGTSWMDFTNNYIRLYSSEGIKNQGVMEFPEDYETALFAAREAKTLDEKKKQLQTASKMLVQDYCMLFPVSVIYNYCFVQSDVQDLNLFQVSATQWTPEAVSRSGK